MGRFNWSPPRGGIAFIAICFILGSIVFISIDGGTPYTRYVCPLFLPVGIGLWLKHPWARWVSICLFLAAAVLLLVAILGNGFSTRRVFQGVIIAGSLIALWEWKVYPEDEDEDED